MLFNLLSTPGEADRITEGVHQHRRTLRISALDKLGHIGVLGGFLTLDERKGFYSTRKLRHRIGDSAALLFSTFVYNVLGEAARGRLGRLRLFCPGIHGTCLLRDGVRWLCFSPGLHSCVLLFFASL